MELKQMPLVHKRIESCRADRLAAPDKGRQKLAQTPALFRETVNPDSFLIVLATSSERRRYIPIGFAGINVIAANSLLIVPDATLYHFGILQSNVHMSWMRAVGGRLKMDYRYSRDIVYNTFPWPQPTLEQRKIIEKTAQGILDARAKYPKDSLASLYDEALMPPELRKAHQANDRAVMTAYGFPIKGFSETDCVAALMRLYQENCQKAACSKKGKN